MSRWKRWRPANLVVAANIGGLMETIIPNVTGLLVPPENSIEMAKAIIFLLQSPERCQGMGSNGRVRVEQHYTLERMINNTENIYTTILEK